MFSSSHPDAFTPSIQKSLHYLSSVPLTLFPMTLSLPTNQSHQNILKFTATLISGDSHCQLHLYHCQPLLCPHKPETLNHSGLRRHPSPISLIVSSTSAIIGYLCPPILGLTTQIHRIFFWKIRVNSTRLATQLNPRPVWPATRLTRLKMTRFDPRPEPDPTRPFCHVYLRVRRERAWEV